MFYHQRSISRPFFSDLIDMLLNTVLRTFIAVRYGENKLLHWPHCSLEEAINRLIAVPRLLAVSGQRRFRYHY